MSGYAGCRVEFNDYYNYNSGQRWYFNDFKKYLDSKGVIYEKLDDTRANILKCDNYYIYFGGGNNFWGFSWNAIGKMLEKAKNNPCYLVLRAYNKAEQKDYYWQVSIPNNFHVEGLEGRLLITETNGKLNFPANLPQKEDWKCEKKQLNT